MVVRRRVVKPRMAKVPQAKGRLQIARLEKRAVPSGMAKLTISPKKLEVEANFSAGNLWNIGACLAKKDYFIE